MTIKIISTNNHSYNASQFIGKKGTLFYDTTDNNIRVSDGTTIGGVVTNNTVKTIVILGSSNGAGAGATGVVSDPTASNNWASPATSWAGLLLAALPGWTMYNRSISGTGTGTSIARFWTDVAPHRPSHVILCTGIANDGYDAQVFYRNTCELIALCELIGAVPVLRSVYPHNAMSAAQYQNMLSLNNALNELNCPMIDHMSTLDNGSGAFVSGSTYHMGDGQHPNDAGYAVLFSAIDLGIFKSADGNVGRRAVGSWLLGLAASSDTGIVLSTSNGLTTNLRSFTMRARIKSQSGVGGSKAFLGASIEGVGNTPLRIRNPSNVYELASGVSVLTSSAVNPISDFTTHDLVMSYNHAVGTASLYIDGALIGSGTPATNSLPITDIRFGSGQTSPTLCASGWAWSDVSAWSVALSAQTIADINRTNTLPRGSLIFDANFSRRPALAQAGVVPNAVRNGLLPTVGVNWTAVANI